MEEDVATGNAEAASSILGNSFQFKQAFVSNMLFLTIAVVTAFVEPPSEKKNI
jgi:hypothetical protein